MNSLTLLEYHCHIFVVTMVTILEQNQYIWKRRKHFSVEMLKKYLSKLKQHELSDTLSYMFLFECLSVMSYEEFIVSIVELNILLW